MGVSLVGLLTIAFALGWGAGCWCMGSRWRAANKLRAQLTAELHAREKAHLALIRGELEMHGVLRPRRLDAKGTPPHGVVITQVDGEG